ncbi:MAG: hypothetical protein HYX68_00685, partial [Planctomycetes bacterium]|nr:hypothetical protein [Planctomycetota bacterium]
MNQILIMAVILVTASAQAPRNYPYAELEGVADEFNFTRNWRAYYWRQDCTLLVRDDAGRTHRIISREPTPWAGHRLGTTYTGLKIDWKAKPRVQIIGVRAIDRQPQEYWLFRFKVQIRGAQGVFMVWMVHTLIAAERPARSRSRLHLCQGRPWPT